MEKEKRTAKRKRSHKETKRKKERDPILSPFYALRDSLESPCFNVSVPPILTHPLASLSFSSSSSLLHTHIPAGPLDRRTAPFSMSSASPGGIGSANIVRRLRWLGVCAKHQIELVCADGMGMGWGWGWNGSGRHGGWG